MKVTYRGRAYERCERCDGWGRENWAHACGTTENPHGNWYSSPEALEAARGWRGPLHQGGHGR